MVDEKIEQSLPGVVSFFLFAVFVCGFMNFHFHLPTIIVDYVGKLLFYKFLIPNIGFSNVIEK